MSYFGFLALFLGIPITALLLIAWWDARSGRGMPGALTHWPVWAALLLNIVIAVVWTTPWDNYLVATRVWWYDPALVTGITLGYVPIEEYTFFVVQPIMTGLFLAFLSRRLPPVTSGLPDLKRARTISLSITMVFWIASVVILVSGWRPGTYLGLELVWALVPMMLQFAFGADILWKNRRNIIIAIVVSTAYLSFADALAIQSGTWTISPEQSLNFYLGGVLPVEELIFFFLTNTLVTLGITLTMAQETRTRLNDVLGGLRGRQAKAARD